MNNDLQDKKALCTPDLTDKTLEGRWIAEVASLKIHLAKLQSELFSAGHSGEEPISDLLHKRGSNRCKLPLKKTNARKKYRK